jgi:hypothetical protein
MNKRRVISVAVCLMVAALVLVVKYHPRTVPIEECSQIYRDYADNPHIAVAFIKDFPVNDTLRVDVTTLQATTDSAWCALLLDFGAPAEFMELYMTDKSLFIGDDVNAITLFYRDKNDLKKRIPNNHPDSRLVIASHNRRTLCIFMTEDNKQKDIIGLTQIKDLKNCH